jgi:AcrR family transcriptional regulator
MPKSKPTPEPAQPADEPTIKTRDRVLQHAMHLFAQQGYEATTVAQIEAASGLSAGSGAMYRHFKSKQDILIAGVADIRARIEANRAAAKVIGTVSAKPKSDVELTQQLRFMHALTLRGMESSRDLMLIMMRGGTALPTEIRHGIEDWLSESMLLTAKNLTSQGAFTGYPKLETDPVAAAYVLMAPLMWSKVLEWNQGLPANLTHERIGEAWIAMMVGMTGEQGDRSGLNK